MKKTLLTLFLCLFLLNTGAFARAQDAVLLKANGDGKIYAVENGKKYWLRTPDIFNSYGYAWNSVRSVSAQELLLYPDARLIALAGDSKVYFVKQNTKRWVASVEAFNTNGFDWRAIRAVTPVDFAQYQNGENITGDVSGDSGTVTVEVTPALGSGAPAGVDFSPLWNVWNTLLEKYRDTTTLDRQKMVQGATDGLVKSLGDPYTVFFEPVHSQKFAEDVAGSFGGIGAELGYKKGVVIIAPLANMPAERAGLKAGDKIVKINATSTADMTVDDAVTIIRGIPGTKVTLTIERAGQDKLLEFTITRETITVPTLDWRMQTTGVAYIKLHNFFGNIESDFTKAVKDARAAGMQKIILDLRNNPGGLLDASINIASEFIPAGKTVVSEDFGADKGKYDFPSSGGSLTQTPVVVLVNSGSASAAEILAGALKDQRGAKLIGEKTFGKGSVQELVQFSGGMSLKVTVAKWLTPSGAAIDQQGITPDIVVPLTDADTAAGKDPQLDEALAIIQTQ